MNTTITLMTIKLIAACLIFNWSADLMKPAIDNISASPDDQAVYQLSKQVNGISAATLAFANSTTEFKPYKKACKVSKDPQVQANCSKIAFMLD